MSEAPVLPRSSSLEQSVELARLASLPRPDYERERAGAAKVLGMRASALDAEVQSIRRSGRPIRLAVDNDAPRPPEFTDEALALRFSTQHEHRLRYVGAWGKWVIFDGTIWRQDETLQTFDHARAICRQASAECPDENTADRLAAAWTVAAVERLARADRRHAATVDQWDADPWLLNTPGGVVDLRTGRMRPHRADDCMTKMTAVAPGGKCPLWLSFLDRAMNSDGELISFIQRMAGYALTGSTREQALFFAYGTGANGKGVTLNTLTGILGSYALVAGMEVFAASHNDRHTTELARLRGARLVTAQETEEGRSWAEARIKALTGGDPVTARFMRQDDFTFQPEFKLVIAGNHRPALRNVDEAIRRRFNLIPFSVKIPAEQRDKDLPEKLKAEWPGILSWAIEGCLEWQRIQLAAPAAVRAATDEYLAAEDALGLWISECCRVSVNYRTTSLDLFASWRAWAERAGEIPGSQKRFNHALETRGFSQCRESGTGRAAFDGVGLKPAHRAIQGRDEPFYDGCSDE